MCDEEICRVDSLRHDSRSEDARTDRERSYPGIALGGHGQSHQFRFGQVLCEVCRRAVRMNVEIEDNDDGASFVGVAGPAGWRESHLEKWSTKRSAGNCRTRAPESDLEALAPTVSP